ncbi:hypothetical protein [Atlantibacter hermannii]|uniref:hypothetical protein n=1 Tax=Atlantibacter hermannii TaxID=565 RepID=UPI000ED443A5|nr:hypothetical protein [Atlantibacter hermannii]HAI51388.1 hypothetical protein [Enterobacteriaceae bacterium]
MSDDTPIITIAKMGTELASALDVQTARSEALAAENAGLKNAISCHAAGFTVCEACGEENISDNDDVCSALNETLVTDAFLAEVRAQGVEMVISYHRERADALHHVDRSNAIRHSMAALDASDVAAQLRQDANTAELVAAGIITRIEG